MASPQSGPIVVISTKSVRIAILLTILFGPLGMLYSTVAGGIIMMVVSLVVGLLTWGFGLILTWPICVIWGALAAESYNQKLIAGSLNPQSVSASRDHYQCLLCTKSYTTLRAMQLHIESTHKLTGHDIDTQIKEI